MPYDFDKQVSRRNTGSMKWDVPENELPMWVADMDFQTAPEIQAAILERAEHGIFGYSIVPNAWYEAYIGWWKSRHGFKIEKDSLIFCTGVVPAISSIVRKLTTVGEKVLVQSPVYPIFYNSILNNGRHVLESPLAYDGEEYHVDFKDLEQKLANPQTSMMILCNPHNPVGKIWDRETLKRIGELCEKHHVLVLSDEIHCDLTDPGCKYIPFASVSDACSRISITCMAPTKAFNLAGLQTAAVMVPDQTLKAKVERGLNTDEVAEPNAFAACAAIAAFTKGGAFLDELRGYLYLNKCRVREYIKKNLPRVRVVPSSATYLLWLDCEALPGSAAQFSSFLRAQTGLYLTDGDEYGGNGKRFLRMNTACPRETLEDGLARLGRGAAAYEALHVKETCE